MAEPLDIKKCFEDIRRNHKRYLLDNMVTYIELSGGLKQSQLIKEYAEDIGFFRTGKERYLNSAIKQVSFGKKAKHCALSVLLGIGVGGAAFLKLKSMRTSPFDFITSLGVSTVTDNAAGAAFSSLLGAGITFLAYEAWIKSAQQPMANDFEQFQAALKEAGFNTKKYEMLSAELIKLFHYRECLLLGLKDNSGVNFREEFIKTHFHSKTLDIKAFNIAIEVYFLDELNKLFNKAFKDIYSIQQQEIIHEAEQNKIITWIKHFFEKPETRYQFTQQLQIHFMEECLGFLEIELNKMTFMGRHPYLTASIVGLIGGAVALSLAVFAFNIPLVIGLATVGLITTCSLAALSYWSARHWHFFKYKRDEANRNAIKHTIENVTKECTRLQRLMQNSVDTSPEDMVFLSKYKDRGCSNVFERLFHSYNKKEVAIGSSMAWLREHASRYRHSKGVENDLGKQHQVIIQRGDVQTKMLQKMLLDELTSTSLLSSSRMLRTFLKNTRAYLSDPKNLEYINKFELIEKIKQQLLEIVAYVPLKASIKELPEELVRFYTVDLGGLKNDLLKVRELAAIIDDQMDINAKHPYQDLLDYAQELNDDLAQDKNYKFLFLGDTDYREKLGLSIDHPLGDTELNINSQNIRSYLECSYQFLCSLNQKGQANTDLKMDEPFENTKEYVLYRMLLIKQLAKLTDPNNLRVDSTVRRDVFQFVQDRLFIDPLRVFDDVINQTLFITKKAEGPTIQDPTSKIHLISDLEWVADALRLDLAYSSKPITPRIFINREVSEFLMFKENVRHTAIFSYGQIENYLVPESSDLYVNKVGMSIASTKEFISHLNDKVRTKNVAVYQLYLKNCCTEVDNLLLKINALNQFLTKRERHFNSIFLKNATDLLVEFRQELQAVIPSPKSPKTHEKKTIFSHETKLEPINLKTKNFARLFEGSIAKEKEKKKMPMHLSINPYIE